VDTVTRRRFLVRSGVVAGAALAAGASGYTIWDILATHDDPGKDAGDRTLVVLTLYGGNDGLATVIPYADPAYHDARPGIGYTADQVLRLDGGTGLNPSMKRLKSLYDNRKLAIVRGVGYPRPDRSHFRSMDIWQTASPQTPATTGWLGRWLDAVGGDPRHAVSLEPVLPPLLAGATSAGAAVSLAGVALPKVITTRDVTALGEPSPGESVLQARAATCFRDLLSVDKLIDDVTAADTGTDDDNDPAGATGTGGGSSPLATQLDLVAKCVEAGVMTRVFSVSQGGFDFHAEEHDAQQRIWQGVDTAVGDFLARMAKSARGRNVVLMIYSEFGRRVRANASDGTDHGTASNVFLAGAPVAGGRLIGEQPSLTDLDNGDLKYHVDFRDVYATVLADVLGADPGQVLNGWKPRIDGLLIGG
jgi:uncharacterized protein (DUF1501 family)